MMLSAVRREAPCRRHRLRPRMAGRWQGVPPRVTGLFGKPKQGYGFSGNPSSMFGPPGFDSAAFEYKGGNLNLPVRLSY